MVQPNYNPPRNPGGPSQNYPQNLTETERTTANGLLTLSSKTPSEIKQEIDSRPELRRILGSFAYCVYDHSFGSNIVTYVGNEPNPPIRPEMVPATILQKMAEPRIWFCGHHRAETGLKSVGYDPATMDYLIIPEEHQITDVESLSQRLKAEGEGYGVVNYKEPTIVGNKISSTPRQAIIFYDKSKYRTAESKQEVLEKLTETPLERDLGDYLKVTGDYPNQIVRPPFEEQTPIYPAQIGIGIEFFVSQMEQPIENPGLVNLLLGASRQLGYRINPDNPTEIRFFEDKYWGASEGAKAERNRAIKGIQVMQGIIQNSRLSRQDQERLEEIVKDPKANELSFQRIADIFGGLIPPDFGNKPI